MLIKFADIDEEATYIAFAFLNVDEEEREKAAQRKALIDALAAAEHANRAKTAFLNNISHDIRTPMNAIIGYTALAASHLDNIETTRMVKSKEGEGTEFVVVLDCKLSDNIVKYEPVPELQGARALVVDDDTNTCISVNKMLKQIGMRADWTVSGKEAIVRAREAYEEGDEFKAYIIDWLMPDMNGIAIL